MHDLPELRYARRDGMAAARAEGQMIKGTGDGVTLHVAARVAALAGAGEVWVSSTVVDLTAGSGLGFRDAGWHSLRGLDGSWQLFTVEDDGTPTVR